MFWKKETFVICSLAFLAACSDIGDRDNPLDPHGANYEVFAEYPSSGIEDDVFSSDSYEGEVSSRSLEESSNSVADSTDSAETSSSSANGSEQTENSSDSVSESSSAVETSSAATSSSNTVVQSSSAEVPASSSLSSSSIAEAPASSSQIASSSEIASSSNVTLPVESSSSLPSSSSVPAITSSAEASSSSVAPESSNSEPVWTCGDKLERDGVEYNTVLIKEQCWMKENMRYEPNEGETMCYGNTGANCEVYGRLYDYNAAKLACPTGWRLPTSNEYVAMAEYSMAGAPLYDAGAHFKSESGWTGESGDDFLEFTALPGGKCDEEQSCRNIGKAGYWWTSTENVKDYSHFALFLTGDDDSYSATTKMTNDQFISVRCVKK